jgi:hypothetical protein
MAAREGRTIDLLAYGLTLDTATIVGSDGVTRQDRYVDHRKERRRIDEAPASARDDFGALSGPHDLFDVNRLAEHSLGMNRTARANRIRLLSPVQRMSREGTSSPTTCRSTASPWQSLCARSRRMQLGRRVEAGSRLSDGLRRGNRPSPGRELSPRPLRARRVPVDDQDALPSRPHDPAPSGRVDLRIRFPSSSPRSHPRSRYRLDRSS